MAGIEHCPHCGCGNEEDYERCKGCGLRPSGVPGDDGQASATRPPQSAPVESQGWYSVTGAGKAGPYGSLREAMVRSLV